jgi:hypothetical protein
MIIILDDTFSERHKYNDVSFLTEKPYSDLCFVIANLKNSEINDIIMSRLPLCKLLCYHKTLQIFNQKGRPIDSNNNHEIRTNLLNTFSNHNIPKIQFSLGNTISDMTSLTINKNLFYSNLKPFLENYISTTLLQYKILFYGEEFKKIEFDEICTELSIEIRQSKLYEDLLKSQFIEKFVLIFGTASETILQQVRLETISKSQLIRLINIQNFKNKST